MAVTRDLWIVLRARDEASRIIRSFGNNVAGASAAAGAGMSGFDRRMQNVAATLNQFAMTSMLAGAAMAGLGAAGLSFIKSATDVAAEYDRQVRHTLTQIDGIKVSLEEVADVGRRVAREVEIPFEQMQETLFFIFSSMNVSLAEAEKLLKGFAQEAVAGQTTVEAAARSNIAIMNSLGLTVDDLTRIQDVQFQVVRKGVITYEELANVIGRALPAAARSGQSIETLGAMIAFLTRNGLSAAMAATSAARAMESFAHPKTIGRLEEMGIKVKDARGEFLPLLVVMDQMNDKLSKLSAPERAKALQELFLGAGGTIQARRFWDTAFKNFGDFEEMVGFMANSTGVFQNAYETMADSVASQTVLLHNKWMLIKEALGRAVMPHLLQLITLLSTILGWFDKLPEPTKTIIAQFILWGSVMSVVIGVLTILVGTLAFFVSGIMMAGTALIGILAAIALLVTSLISLSAAFYLAWQNSQNFRNIVMDIKELLSDIANEVGNVAAKAKQSFDQNLRPAFENLWNIINTKVLPAIREFVQIWKEEVFPKIQEAGRIISDMFSKVFEVLAATINDVIIPNLKIMADWWERNQDKLRPFLEVAAQLAKVLLIVAAALLAMPLASIIGMIAAVVVVIVGFVTTLQTLWNWIVTAFNAVVAFFTGIRDTVVGFIMKIVTEVEQFLRPITNLIKEVFGLIVDVIRFFVVLGTEIIKDWVVPFLKLIISPFVAAWNFIVEVTNIIIRVIKEWLERIFGDVKRASQPIFDEIVKVWNGIKDFLKGVVSGIIDFFKNAGKWLFDAGKSIITGLIDGITEKIKDLRKKLQEITDLIPKVKGPKSVDLKLLVPVGQNIMQGFMNGIESQIPMLKAQLQGLTTQIGQIPSPQLTMPVPSFASQTPTTQQNITQNITVTTQEINPRIHAEELGFELGNRM